MKLLLSLALLYALCSPSWGAETRWPNVIFILTDDRGWGDAHFVGHPYVKSPNFDRLSASREDPAWWHRLTAKHYRPSN